MTRADTDAASGRFTSPAWNLMASHGVVLFYIAQNPSSTMREMSEALDLTERRISRIVKDLAEAEMVAVTKTGRRNSYSVNRDANFIHPTLSHIKLAVFIDAICEPSKPGTSRPGLNSTLFGLWLPLQLASTEIGLLGLPV